MPKSTKALEAIAALKQLRSAPSVIVPGKLSELEKAVLESKGEYGAKRVQKAADEIKNLEHQYTLDALKDAFLGDNAKALMIGKPESAKIFLPNSSFVPFIRTTSGTDKLTALHAVTTPSAITSQRIMPPKILTKIAFTLLFLSIILNASVTFSAVAPPPTSKKLAG